ncbi:MAG: hypothetical protein M3419_12425 [Actinomycetota bacterium]|nr:hypothetical protein [Actinomycetota bacterium]
MRGSVERLVAVGGRHIGNVLNRTPAKGRGYGYGYAPDAGARTDEEASKVKKSRKSRRHEKVSESS